MSSHKTAHKVSEIPVALVSEERLGREENEAHEYQQAQQARRGAEEARKLQNRYSPFVSGPRLFL